MNRALRHIWRRRQLRARSVWLVAPMWVGLAVALGLVTDEVAASLVARVSSPMSSDSAISLLSAVAAGMITFTGLVFSMVFVILQFGSTAYTPRLVREITLHGRIMGHAFGVFTGTFVYALLAIRTVDIEGGPGVNTAVIAVAFLWLLASVVLFLALIPRIRTLSVSQILALVGRLGRDAISRTYPPTSRDLRPAPPPGALPPATQVIRHRGAPGHIQDLDTEALVAIARDVGGIVSIPHAVGDLILPDAPLVLVLGGATPIFERRARRAIPIGPERTVHRDPAYAIRLLVDIAIRGLSPAVNDPTTAVEALDQIGSLLIQLGRSPLEDGRVADEDGHLRLTYDGPSWEDLLSLALIEIQQYGSQSVQIQRRLGALLRDLDEMLPAPRRPALQSFLARREASLPVQFQPDGLVPEASAHDRQGLGHTS